MTTRTPSTELLHRTLVSALREGGKILKKHFRRLPSVSHKQSPIDLITVADRQADKKVLQVIGRRFAHHQFLTEESLPRVSSSPYRWVVDPLDGTTNFAHGFPHACVSIGLEKNGRVILGGIYDPFKEEMFLAGRGRGARLNGRRVGVSKARRLQESLVVTGFPYDRQKRAAFYLKYVNRFLKSTQGVRRVGAAALDLAYVACGRFDGYWEFNLKPWDVAAGSLLVEEAGGRVSNFKKKPFSLENTSQTLASNGFIHGPMAQVLSHN